MNDNRRVQLPSEVGLWYGSWYVFAVTTVGVDTWGDLIDAAAGVYSVQVNGGFGNVTNFATLSLPNAPNLTALKSGNSLRIDWPLGYTGWKLQTQAGISGNWQTIGGAEFTNSWLAPLQPANPGAFFRLLSP